MAALVLVADAFGAEFIPLGRSPGQHANVARDISPDGTVVVGGTWPAYSWTELEGFRELMPTGYAFNAEAVSNEGRVIVGDVSNTSDYCGPCVPGVWTADAGLVRIPFEDGRAFDVSADGTVVVGAAAAWNDPARAAFRWTAESGAVTIELPEGPSAAYGVSADGSIVVGQVNDQAFRWTEVGTKLLGDLTGGDFYSGAVALSEDGSVIIGTSKSDGNRNQAFRWTAAEGMVGLGTLPNLPWSWAFDVSADGSTVVGFSTNNSLQDPQQRALVWDEVHGLRNLQNVLATEYGLGAALEGWNLEDATGISADGLSIVGRAKYRQGATQGWLVRVDRPFATLRGDYNGNGIVEEADLSLVLMHWGQDASAVSETWTHDLPKGIIDQAELDAVLLFWGTASSSPSALVVASTPEPPSLAILLLAAGAALLLCIRGRTARPKRDTHAIRRRDTMPADRG